MPFHSHSGPEQNGHTSLLHRGLSSRTILYAPGRRTGYPPLQEESRRFSKSAIKSFARAFAPSAAKRNYAIPFDLPFNSATSFDGQTAVRLAVQTGSPLIAQTTAPSAAGPSVIQNAVTSSGALSAVQTAVPSTTVPSALNTTRPSFFRLFPPRIALLPVGAPIPRTRGPQDFIYYLLIEN